MHSIGTCDCPSRRVIHWPANARFGETWTCYDCGKTWSLAPGGTPGAVPNVIGASKPPRRPKGGGRNGGRSVNGHARPAGQWPRRRLA
jgi:hypothetical protein